MSPLEIHGLSFGAAFGIALLASTGGVTGAFLLLPFQVSVLGITSPSVTATNHLYNVFAAPGGVLRYWQEKRLTGPLTVILTAGTIPGILIGLYLRVAVLADAGRFKLFAGVVLLALSVILLLRTRLRAKKTDPPEVRSGEVECCTLTLWRLGFDFGGQSYGVLTPVVFFFSFLVGVVGGAYGVGGGVFTSAFLVGVCGLPVYTTAGATLFATFLSSVVGALGMTVMQTMGWTLGHQVGPDYSLGLALGLGGLAGSYLGARLQKRAPSLWIRLLLAAFMLFVGARYVLEF